MECRDAVSATPAMRVEGPQDGYAWRFTWLHPSYLGNYLHLWPCPFPLQGGPQTDSPINLW